MQRTIVFVIGLLIHGFAGVRLKKKTRLPSTTEPELAPKAVAPQLEISPPLQNESGAGAFSMICRAKFAEIKDFPLIVKIVDTGTQKKKSLTAKGYPLTGAKTGTMEKMGISLKREAFIMKQFKGVDGFVQLQAYIDSARCHSIAMNTQAWVDLFPWPLEPELFAQKKALRAAAQEGTLHMFVMNYAGSQKWYELDKEAQLARIPALEQHIHRMHEAGVYHLDLRPDNVMVNEGEITIIDFGFSLSRKFSETYEIKEMEKRRTLSASSSIISSQEMRLPWAVRSIRPSITSWKAPQNIVSPS